MHRLWNAALLMLATVACSSAWAAPAWEDVNPVISGSSIQFQSKDGSTSRIEVSPLKDLVFLGWLRPAGNAVPYVLVSGSSSEVAERALFVIRADGKLKAQRMTYPGKLLDPKTREIVHESRAFFGRCLAEQTHDALVLYQRDRVDKKNRLASSMYVAEASPNLLTERLVERRLPSIGSLQLRVRTRQCSEISGRNRLYNASFFQFRNRGAELPDSDEDDEKEKDKGKDGDEEADAEKAQYETSEAKSRELRTERAMLRLVDGT